MTVEIQDWLPRWQQAVEEAFGTRIRLLGLQGSHARGEATADSDIDVVLILDRLEPADLVRYRAVLDSLPEREKICGFTAGAAELACWEPADLFQFYHDTRSLRGDLDALLPPIGPADVRQAIWSGVCGLYHLSGHAFLHRHGPDVWEEALRELHKSAVFVLQAIAFDRTGRYLRGGSLREGLTTEEWAIFQTDECLKKGEKLSETEQDEAFVRLLTWAGQLIREYGNAKGG